MGRLSIEGYSFQGGLEDFDTLTKLGKKRFATVMPIGTNRAALDVVSSGYFVVGASDRVVEAGSTNSLVVLTAHGARVGDIIRLKTTAGTITQREIAVKEIVDANNFLLEGLLDVDLQAADTFDLLRGVSQTLDSDGGIAISTPTLQFIKDSANVFVTEDTVTPANNIPLPVKLVDITGDINITAGDLNVQLSHNAASPDSVQIGDGTNIMAVSGLGAASVNDSATQVAIASMSAKLPATLGQKAMAASMSVAIASDQSALPISAASLPLPIGAATEAKQDTNTIQVAMVVANTAAISGKLPATLGQKAMVASLAVAIASDQSALPITASSLPLPTGAATEATLALLEGKDFATQTTLALVATEATLAAQSAKLPATLGQKAASASMAVVMASDYVPPVPAGMGARQFVRNVYSSTNVTTGAFVELTASLTQAMDKAEIFDSSGQTLEIATGAAASEVVRFRVFPGGNGIIPLDNTIFAASTRVSIRAVSALADAGEININFYSN